MPQDITVTVPTVDDVKDLIQDTTGDIVEAVDNDLEETVERSNPANLTVTQKVLIGAIVAGGVALVVRKIRRLRNTVTVEVDIENEDGSVETVEGELLVGE